MIYTDLHITEDKAVRKIVRAIVVFVAVLSLVACGNVGTKDELSDAVETLTLLDTTPYIPVQKFDEKTAVFLPYEAKENPYLQLKGRINKEAVTKFIQARRALKAESYQKAENLLNDIIILAPKLSGPWVMRGDIALKKEQLDDAISHYQKSIEVNASNVNAYIKLAKAQRMKGEFLASQNTYAQALSVWPDFPEAHLNLGVLYDVYLNHPLRAQKHMQAYQFLTSKEDKKVALWIEEIQKRTGVKTNLTLK